MLKIHQFCSCARNVHKKFCFVFISIRPDCRLWNKLLCKCALKLELVSVRCIVFSRIIFDRLFKTYCGWIAIVCVMGLFLFIFPLFRRSSSSSFWTNFVRYKSIWCCIRMSHLCKILEFFHHHKCNILFVSVFCFVAKKVLLYWEYIITVLCTSVVLYCLAANNHSHYGRWHYLSYNRIENDWSNINLTFNVRTNVQAPQFDCNSFLFCYAKIKKNSTNLSACKLCDEYPNGFSFKHWFGNDETNKRISFLDECIFYVIHRDESHRIDIPSICFQKNAETFFLVQKQKRLRCMPLQERKCLSNS